MEEIEKKILKNSFGSSGSRESNVNWKDAYYLVLVYFGVVLILINKWKTLYWTFAKQLANNYNKSPVLSLSLFFLFFSFPKVTLLRKIEFASGALCGSQLFVVLYLYLLFFQIGKLKIIIPKLYI